MGTPTLLMHYVCHVSRVPDRKPPGLDVFDSENRRTLTLTQVTLTPAKALVWVSTLDVGDKSQNAFYAASPTLRPGPGTTGVRPPLGPGTRPLTRWVTEGPPEWNGSLSSHLCRASLLSSWCSRRWALGCWQSLSRSGRSTWQRSLRVTRASARKSPAATPSETPVLPTPVPTS